MHLRAFLRLAILGSLLAVLPFLPMHGIAPEIQAQTAKAEWTFLIYMDADCDLERATIEQLKVLAAHGSTKDIHIVVLCDRSPLGEEEDGYSNEGVANLKNWASGKLLYVQKEKLVELADWGDVNMGDPALLHKFIVTGARRYPAKRYALILGDHGSGWSGLCSDDSHNGAALTLNKLRSALQAASREMGPFEIIGFDCCLMATVEVASTIAPFGRYMVASEELEPDDGWDFKAILDALKKKPTMNGAELGKVICSSYQDQFDKSDDEDQRAAGMGVTLSVVDLAKVAGLELAINLLADRKVRLLREERFKGWVKLAKARARTEEYGRDGDQDAESTTFDLGHLAQRVRKLDTGAGTACDAVDKALKAAVVFKVSGSGLPNSAGLSICFPRRADDLEEDDDNKYEQLPFARNTRWLAFLRQYIAVAEQVQGAPELKPVEVSQTVLQLDKKETVTVTSGIKGAADDIDEAYFLLAVKEGKKRIVIGQMPAKLGDDGALKEKWDGGWFVIGRKDAQDRWLTCPIVGMQEVEGKKDTFMADVPAQVRRKGGKNWIHVTLHFYLEFGKDGVVGKFLYAFMHEKAGPRQIKLDKGDEVRPVYVEIDAKGNEKHIASERKDDILVLERANDLRVGYRPVAKGTYFVGFGVTNLVGHRDDEDVEVKVK